MGSWVERNEEERPHLD
jgi:hypothetical protein